MITFSNIRKLKVHKVFFQCLRKDEKKKHFSSLFLSYH